LDFLLGTDLLTTLGFDLIQTNGEKEGSQPPEKLKRQSLGIQLIPRTETEQVTRGNDQQLEVNNYHVTVRLLQAVKIPAHHS